MPSESPPRPQGTPPVLQVRDLLLLRGGRPVCLPVQASLDAGQVLELHGPNGSGKSTLLRALAGQLPPASGRLQWRGAPMARGRPEVAWLPQRPPLHAPLTVLENLRWAQLVRQATDGGADDVQRALQALDRFGLRTRADHPAGELSHGQQRRLGLARMLLTDAPLWLLDEPLDGLDHEGTETLHAVLDEHLGRGGLLVVATHGATRAWPQPAARLTLRPLMLDADPAREAAA